ncbi:MAG TPA: response regulator [Bacteroidales bacterium]|nr:response regulator [Bacteroidales bacterium]
MKIFILDDDDISNELSKIILGTMDITDIDVCTNAEEAIEYLQRSKEENDFPDLMFVDINLRGMSGFEFRNLYESEFMEHNPGSKIIMLTNSVVDEDREEAMKYDSVLDFWSKPLSIPKMKELLRTMKIPT